MASETNFDVQAEFRALTERSLQQAKQAFDSLLAAGVHAASTAGTQVSKAQTGAREAGELAMHFAERNIRSGFDFAQKLARAKDAQEIMALHADYAASQIAALGEQAKELSGKAAELAGQGTH